MKKIEKINLEMLANYRIDIKSMKSIVGGDDELVSGCCGCGCLGTSSTADNSSANVIGFKQTPGDWKGQIVNGKGICILAYYDPKTGKYTEVDHGSRC